MANPDGAIPVFNVAAAPYRAVGDGTTDNWIAFNSAITDIQKSGVPGILYVPPSAAGFLISNGKLAISSHNIVLQGAGGMGSDGNGLGASTIIGSGPGSTFNITGMGCAVRDLAFKTSGGQSGSDSYLYISQTGAGGSQGQIWVDNVHMYSPNIGITLTEPSNPDGGAGEYWIERLLIEGTTAVGGMLVDVAGAAVELRHVIMAQQPDTPFPEYGIQVVSAGELVLSGGCDIIAMGNCLSLVPGQDQSVNAVLVSDSLFDGGGYQQHTGTYSGNVLIAPSGNGYVAMVRFSNVWASTGNATSNANGFAFFGTGSTTPFPSILDVSLVNCVAQGFTGAIGLYASKVVGLTVTASTFGGNYDGIDIAADMTHFILNGNKCGNYTVHGGNSNYGIVIEPGASSDFIVIGNLLGGNTAGGLFNGGTGGNQAVAHNVL